MIAALIYQSLLAACGLGLALAVFYGGHRLLIRKNFRKPRRAARLLCACCSETSRMLSLLERRFAPTAIMAFFQERIHRQAQRAAASTLRVWFLPQFARIVADQGAVLVFLGIVVAVQLREGDVRQLLSLLVFYFVLSRRMLPLISQISFIAGQIEGSYEIVKVVDSELRKCRTFRTYHRLCTCRITARSCR